MSAVVVGAEAGSTELFAKAVRLGLGYRDISQMPMPVADILTQELRQLYRRRCHVQQYSAPGKSFYRATLGYHGTHRLK